MAKRMKFSVVGLPHYTIWHLYEPSVDDIRHMEEMENERKAREAEEKAKQEKIDRIQSQFDDTATQWAKDKDMIQDLKAKESEVKAKVKDKAKAVTGEESAPKEADDIAT